MKHAIVLAHPNAESFNASIAATYSKALEREGHDVLMRDLYKLGFDPCLKAGEIPGPEGFSPEPDVVAERLLLADVEVFTFIYPFWFNSPPAILKGYVDRIFGMGFGYQPVFGGTRPALTGRRLVSFSTSGAPDAWVQSTGALEALKTRFDEHLAGVCGLVVAGHLHFGGIVSDITAESIDTLLAQVRAVAQRPLAMAMEA